METQRNVTCLITYTPIRSSSREVWYFDSGLSRHVTGEEIHLEELKPYSIYYVMFGDGARGRIKYIGKLVSPSFPCLNNVVLVEGLNAKLINIS